MEIMLLVDARDELEHEVTQDEIFEGTFPYNPLSKLAFYEQRYPRAMKLLRVGGLHPSTSGPMINPYTGELDTESVDNIFEHCLAAAEGCRAISSSLVRSWALSENSAERCVISALIHDGSKRYELFRRNAVRQGKIENAYSPSAYDTIVPHLQAQNVDPDLIEYMKIAGKETGHNSLASFVKLGPNGRVQLKSGRLVDQIMHYVDDITSTTIPPAGERAKTYFSTPRQKMEHSGFPKRYPFMYKEGFGFDVNGNVVLINDTKNPPPGLSNVEDYATYQIFVSNSIAEHLVGTGGLLLPEYLIKDMVSNQLR